MQSEAELREKILDIGRRMYARKMIAANDGNISVKLGEHEFLCTPTGVSKGFMTDEMLCRVDEKGKLLEANGKYTPSSEIKMHMMVYEKRKDVKAVVHAHPIYSTIYACAGLPLEKPVLAEAVTYLGTVPLARFGTPSTIEVPESIKDFLPDYDAVLLESHGALTYGADLEKAFYKMESVEFYAELLYKLELRGEVRTFDKDTVEKLYDMRRAMDLPGRHPAVPRKE